MNDGYSIGGLARAGGVNVETIRYYERRKLLRQPVRPHGQIRRYGAAELAALQFIKRAQAAGFSLDEVEVLLLLRRRQACRETRQLAAKKLASVEMRLRELKALRAELKHWVRQCDANEDANACPTLARLNGCGKDHREMGR